MIDSEVCLTGRGGIAARVSHWAFGQLARMADAPAGYLRGLPATLATQNINYGLKTAADQAPDATVNIMAHSNGSILVRALTSNYARIWNYEVLGRMLPLEQDGWTCPTPFRVRADEASNPDPTVYVSDHDMFAFLVREDCRIAEPGNPDGLARGFFVENSEGGAAALKVTTFLYRYMCCNHIVWGAKDVSELAVRPRQGSRQPVHHVHRPNRYLNESASDVEAKIKEKAETRIIDADKDKVLDAIFRNLRGQVSRDTLVESQKLAVQHSLTDGDPRSYWGMAQGMTRHSQTLKFADARMAVDKAAANVIDMALSTLGEPFAGFPLPSRDASPYRDAETQKRQTGRMEVYVTSTKNYDPHAVGSVFPCRAMALPHAAGRGTMPNRCARPRGPVRGAAGRVTRVALEPYAD